MKKNILLFCLSLLVALPLTSKAKEITSYTNSEGVEIPYSVYLDLQRAFSDNYIEFLTQDEYDNLMNLNLDFDTVNQDVKFFRTDINNVTGEITNTEITESEYMAVNPEPENEPQATVVETTYKKIILSTVSTPSGAFFSFNARWKIMPATRSFDVIAGRFQGASKVNGTQGGKQFYTANGVSSHIDYGANGTNINNQSNGFGISMNLVDNATALECVITSSLSVSSYPVVVNASYQHATTNVSLATSKSYTLSSAGLGGVINFTGGIGSYYDGMNGTYQYLYS